MSVESKRKHREIVKARKKADIKKESKKHIYTHKGGEGSFLRQEELK